MNLPNKLTTLRVLMIPFFVVFMLTDLGGAYSKYIAVGIFIVACLTFWTVRLRDSITWSPISENSWIRWQISF